MPESKLSFIQRIPRMAMVFIGVLSSLLIACLDFISGWEISFAVVYLLPVYFVAWYVGKKAGIAVAVLCGLLRFSVSMQENAPYGSILPIVSNVSMRLVFFIFTAYLLSSLKQALALADMRAKVDPLTLIPNRRYFDELCEREIARMERYKQPFAIGYMDIDNFKGVNDTLGHSAGNDLLKAVAATLQSQIRPTDAAARLGGDEFAIILSETGVEGAAIFFPRLKKALDDLVSVRQWPVTFSIGVVTFIASPHSVDEVLRLTDILMYGSKKGGKDRIGFNVYELSSTPPPEKHP